MLIYFKYSVNTQIHSTCTVTGVEKYKIGALKTFLFSFISAEYLQKI